MNTNILKELKNITIKDKIQFEILKNKDNNKFSFIILHEEIDKEIIFNPNYRTILENMIKSLIKKPLQLSFYCNRVPHTDSYYEHISIQYIKENEDLTTTTF